MARCVWPYALVGLLVLAFAGCSQQIERARRPAWREQAEKACIAEHRMRLSRYLQPRGGAIDGPGICGMTQPFMVGALADDKVQLDSVATLDCPMIAALNEWIESVVEPDAQARFGQGVAQIDTMGSYSCRGMNGQAGARISEHAFGNAIDIAGFRLADGRRLTVVHDWTQGDDQSQAFLRDVHAGACNSFTTVLGPGSNAFHYNHIHVDLAMHGRYSGGARHICKPVPEVSRPVERRDNLPDPPVVEEDEDVASSAVPSGGRLERGPNVASPPVYASVARRNAGESAGFERGSHQYDGSSAPEGAPSEWDVTSSIRGR